MSEIIGAASTTTNPPPVVRVSRTRRPPALKDGVTTDVYSQVHWFIFTIRLALLIVALCLEVFVMVLDDQRRAEHRWKKVTALVLNGAIVFFSAIEIWIEYKLNSIFLVLHREELFCCGPDIRCWFDKDGNFTVGFLPMLVLLSSILGTIFAAGELHEFEAKKKNHMFRMNMGPLILAILALLLCIFKMLRPPIPENVIQPSAADTAPATAPAPTTTRNPTTIASASNV